MRRPGFTLIELLIVVAIIAILAAIALPNMLEAQTRAKLSRVAADMRAIAAALEVYRIDHNQYPAENYFSPFLEVADGDLVLPNRIKLRPLTSPVAYLTSLPVDPFASAADPANMLPPPVYHYVALNDAIYPNQIFFFGGGNNVEGRPCLWAIQSNGPDRAPDTPHWQFPRYDPTNGTLSWGNILLLGP
jgi:type II secretion system protein G